MLPFTKKFACTYPRANAVLFVGATIALTAGLIVLVQTRPQPQRDTWWAVALFLTAASTVSSSARSAMRGSLTPITAERARWLVVLGALELAVGLPSLIFGFVVGDLRDIGQATFFLALATSFFITGRLSPSRPSWW